MIRTLAFLAIVASAFGNDSWNAGIHSFFDAIFGFIKHPWTIDDALKAGYEKVENPPAPLSSGYSGLVLYLTKSDGYRIGIYYDETGQICGLLILLPVDKITPHFDLEKKGFNSWTYKSVKYLTKTIFFVPEDKQSRIRSANSTQLIRGDYLWLQGLDGTLDKIPITAAEIAAHPDWKMQACVPWMGQHYFNKMTPTLSCEEIHPWFLLTDEDTNQLIGAGMLWPGTNKCGLENPSASDVKMIVPTAPQCLYDLVEKNGASTLHFYFVDHPRLIVC